jgi:hypothetical protein
MTIMNTATACVSMVAIKAMTTHESFYRNENPQRWLCTDPFGKLDYLSLAKTNLSNERCYNPGIYNNYAGVSIVSVENETAITKADIFYN